MADSEFTSTQDSTAAAEPQQTHSQDNVDETTSKLNDLTLRIWPPTQRTRDAVINRLIEVLSSQSALSKRYGTIPEDEASAAAKSIEGDAFSVAGASFCDHDEGIETLRLYSSEISKRMIDTVKVRAATAASDPPSGSVEVDSKDAVGAVSEEISSLSV